MWAFAFEMNVFTIYTFFPASLKSHCDATWPSTTTLFINAIRADTFYPFFLQLFPSGVATAHYTFRESVLLDLRRDAVSDTMERLWGIEQRPL